MEEAKFTMQVWSQNNTQQAKSPNKESHNNNNANFDHH